MANPIETRGMEILKRKLTAQGRTVALSDNKTFDLIVDGRYAEVKTKHRPYRYIDFISFTDNQYAEIQKTDFSIFLVSNVGDPDEDKAEIWEVESSRLRGHAPKTYTSHEFNKSLLDGLKI
jgi:hypothetical protein